MSKFGATEHPIPAPVSPALKITSEIIDAFSNATYVFLKVSVRFSIHFSFKICYLEQDASFVGCGFACPYRGSQLPYALRELLDRKVAYQFDWKNCR